MIDMLFAVGIVALAAMVTAMAHIWTTPEMWCRYGREAFQAAMLYLAFTAAVRLGSFVGVLGPSDGRTLTGIGAVVASVILIELGYLHWTEHHYHTPTDEELFR